MLKRRVRGALSWNSYSNSNSISLPRTFNINLKANMVIIWTDALDKYIYLRLGAGVWGAWGMGA